jgi:hypothetical protein
MAGWEEELAVLLRELGVKQEEPNEAHLRSMRKPMRSDIKWQEHYADAQHFWKEENGHSGENRESKESRLEDEDEVWRQDLHLMRCQVDEIVNQVVLLTQRGALDTSLKEDVLVVLRALRRRAAITQQAATGDEAYLESASAMLHFCRLVLQLSEFATGDL